jgi:hypothetical protein
MLKAQAKNIPVCLTVTHLDALNLARSGFNHAVNYRSAMVYRLAHIVQGADKLRMMDNFVDRLYPGRSKILREATAAEIKATVIMGMPIDQASGKIRDVAFRDDEQDYSVPAWIAIIPAHSVNGEIVKCPCQHPNVTMPAEMSSYRASRKLDDILHDVYEITLGSAEVAPQST